MMMLAFGKVIGVGKGMDLDVFVSLRKEAIDGFASKRFQHSVKPLISRRGWKLSE